MNETEQLAKRLLDTSRMTKHERGYCKALLNNNAQRQEMLSRLAFKYLPLREPVKDNQNENKHQSAA